MCLSPYISIFRCLYSLYLFDIVRGTVCKITMLRATMLYRQRQDILPIY